MLNTNHAVFWDMIAAILVVFLGLGWIARLNRRGTLTTTRIIVIFFVMAMCIVGLGLGWSWFYGDSNGAFAPACNLLNSGLRSCA